MYTKYVLLLANYIRETTILYIMSAILSYSYRKLKIPITPCITVGYRDSYQLAFNLFNHV